MICLVLILASALLHALWNALLKRAGNLEAASLGILAVALALTGSALPWLPGPLLPGSRTLAWVLGAGLCEGCYFLSLIRALERGPWGGATPGCGGRRCWGCGRCPSCSSGKA